MNNISLIIQREYLTRVKKKSFIIMTIVGPILMAALFIVPAWLALADNEEVKTVMVYDKTGKYQKALTETKTLKFEFINETNPEKRKKEFLSSGSDAMLSVLDTLSSNFVLYSETTPDINIKEQISSKLELFLKDENYKKLGIDKAKLDSAEVHINLETKILSEEGERTSSAELPLIIGFICAFVIYMFIFMYGVQVMRGVIEEKVNRVVEVLVSSVKPFQLMAGKIIGIALVALTQFILWVVFTGIIVAFVFMVFGSTIAPGIESLQMQNINAGQLENLNISDNLSEAILGFVNFNWTAVIITFLVFFFGGYLLYSSMFAAIGAAVDNETDNQQFMLPVTVPLILAIVVAQGIIKNPEGALAFWFSVIPFTAPIIMPIRVALGQYEIWELVLSGVLLFATFTGIIWLAGRIYRVGILMYGKKVSYKELWKWLKYK